MEETMESLVDEDHADRLRTRLAVLCNNKDLCDVVLTSADGCDVQAHWLVLASSSEYFAAMRFSPIIYTDLDISELSVIVNYIYTGKVSIIPEKKDKLLQGSKKLKLNSLVSLIVNSCNTIAISCPQNQEIDEAFKSIPNQSIESQHKKQSPNLLHAWTKHNKSGTSISSGLSERGSDGAGVDGQCRSDGSSVQFPVGLVQNVSSIESAPLSVSQVSATQSHSRNQIAPVEPHPVAWNWDLQTSDMAEGSQNEMTPHKLIENVDYKIKEEVLSEEEHNFTFFAPPETETEPLQGDSVPPRTPFNGGPGGSPGGARERKRRTRGETDSGSRMVSETVSTTNGGEEAKEADKWKLVEDPKDQNPFSGEILSDIFNPSNSTLISNNALFICEQCGESHPSKQSLYLHREKKHFNVSGSQFTKPNKRPFIKDYNPKKRIYRCFCGREFSYFSVLQRHTAMCTGTSGVICPVCNQSFSRKDSLTRHMKGVHEHMNVHKCVCNKNFRWSSGLAKHRKNCHFVMNETMNLI